MRHARVRAGPYTAFIGRLRGERGRGWPFVLNAFTVDVEDWFQVSAFEHLFPRAGWDAVPLRVDTGVTRVLDLLDEAGVRGTFFILGWLAQRRPDLVRAIADRGHELGCHSLEHRLVYAMTPETFRTDLRASLDAIEQAAGARVTLFRAPSFSITKASTWALPILAEEGITIDSSIYPVVHDRYGIPGAPRGPFRPLADHPDFVEFPASTFRLAGMTLPCAGGGYFRLYPLALTQRAVRQINGDDGRPAVFYVHPWEFDPTQPKADAGAARNFRHRVNLARTGDRVRALLGAARFGTMSETLVALGGPAALPLLDVLAPAAARTHSG